MTTVTHASLTGADLHEPKGVAAAASGSVYVANGTGSGTWTDASSVITNSAWQTGDTKLTFQTSAPSTWIMFAEGGTIGDASSGATVRANADTSNLYTLFWDNCSNTICPVTGGRGTSASADFAAHKALQLPPMSSRVLGVSGTGASLTARTLGASYGAETYAIQRSDLPNVAPTATFNGTTQTWNLNQSVAYQTIGVSGGGGNGLAGGPITPNVTVTPSGSVTVQSLNGNVTQTTLSLIQPAVFLNLMIKL